METQPGTEGHPQGGLELLPWSVVMQAGTPYLKTQQSIRESTQVEVSMFFNGAASSHLVVWSTIVSR
jgi:hypothetical protein